MKSNNFHFCLALIYGALAEVSWWSASGALRQSRPLLIETENMVSTVSIWQSRDTGHTLKISEEPLETGQFLVCLFCAASNSFIFVGRRSSVPCKSQRLGRQWRNRCCRSVLVVKMFEVQSQFLEGAWEAGGFSNRIWSRELGRRHKNCMACGFKHFDIQNFRQNHVSSCEKTNSSMRHTWHRCITSHDRTNRWV